MSWASQFARSFFGGLTGAGPVTHADQTPLHQALDQINSAAAQVGGALETAASATVDTYLETKIGPVGTAIADASLKALIAAAEAKLSPAAKPTPPAPATVAPAPAG